MQKTKHNSTQISWTPEFALHKSWFLLNIESQIESPPLTYPEIVAEYNLHSDKYSGIAMAHRDDLTLLPSYSDKSLNPELYKTDLSKFMDYLHHTADKSIVNPYMILLDSRFIKMAVTSTECINKSIHHQNIAGDVYWLFYGTPYLAEEIPDKTAIREKHSKLIDKMSTSKKDGEFFNDLYFYKVSEDLWKDGTSLLWIIAKYTNFDVDLTFEIFKGSILMNSIWLAKSKSGNSKGIDYIRKLFNDRPIFHKNEVEGFLSFHYSVRFNEVTHRVELKCGKNYAPMTDFQLNSIHRHLQNKGGKISVQNLRQLLESDFTERFHPFRSYFTSLPQWEKQKDPISELASTVKTTDQAYWIWSLKKWLVAAVGCAIDHDVINHQALILMGRQGIGKTRWLEGLLPPELRLYMFSGIMDPSNKDFLSNLVECFLLNIDEFDSLSHKKEAELKEIITKKNLRYRVPYGHYNNNYHRCASFMGSVNHDSILGDTSGSRRFLVHECIDIDYQHKVDIDRVWAQAYTLYKEGFKFYFDQQDNQRISSKNVAFEAQSPEEELLLKMYEPISNDDPKAIKMTATDILKQLNLSINHKSLSVLGKALKKHGFESTKIRGSKIWRIEPVNNIRICSGSLFDDEDHGEGVSDE